jgi:hypothetical protein
MNHQSDSLHVLRGFGVARFAETSGRCQRIGGGPKFHRFFILWLLALGLSGFGVSSLAQDSAPSEYQVKAAFLYNFAKFIEWPPQAFATPSSPIIIGILGENVFGDNLEKTVAGKVVNNRSLQVKRIDTTSAATNCQILFISASEKDRFPKILQDLQGSGVLTVSDTDHFMESGGMINFVLESNKIHFQINDEAAKKAGLKISSKLLSLAVHPH